jgi:glycosyltransferase involved in cell wall biosynthesis
MTIELFRRISPSVSVYHYISSVETAQPTPGIIKAHLELLKTSDIVFANCQKLLDLAKEHTPRAHLFRAGVDIETFERIEQSNFSKPVDLVQLQRPIIGYVGTIHRWVDLDLLGHVAGILSQYSFAMVGPLVIDVSPLKSSRNIYWLGQKPHEVIPQYIKYFDVCIIPYVRDKYTESSFPNKLNEYLALGKPVVATALPEIVAFNQQYNGPLFIASDAASSANSICQALGSVSETRSEEYRKIARANSWGPIVENMCHVITEVLHSKVGT